MATNLVAGKPKPLSRYRAVMIVPSNGDPSLVFSTVRDARQYAHLRPNVDFQFHMLYNVDDIDDMLSECSTGKAVRLTLENVRERQINMNINR